MAKVVKNGVKPSKRERKPKMASVPESKVEIHVVSEKEQKLTSELRKRYDLLSDFLLNLDDSVYQRNILPTLSDCEKVLGMAYDCRNSARKLQNIKSEVIIA